MAAQAPPLAPAVAAMARHATLWPVQAWRWHSALQKGIVLQPVHTRIRSRVVPSALRPQWPHAVLAAAAAVAVHALMVATARPAANAVLPPWFAAAERAGSEPRASATRRARSGLASTNTASTSVLVNAAP